MARIARNARFVERGALVADTQPIACRLWSHDSGAQDIGARVREGGTPQANDQHDRRHAHLPHRQREPRPLGRRAQPHSWTPAEAEPPRAQAIGREGTHLRVGKGYGIFT